MHAIRNPDHRQTQTKCTLRLEIWQKKKGSIKSKQNNRQQHRSKHHTHCKQMRQHQCKHTHTLQTNENQKKSMPYRSYAIRNPAIAKHKQNARKTEIWQKKKGVSSQSKIIDNNTKSKYHTHCKQMRIRKNQCQTDARTTMPWHPQTKTTCTQDDNMT